MVSQWSSGNTSMSVPKAACRSVVRISRILPNQKVAVVAAMVGGGVRKGGVNPGLIRLGEFCLIETGSQRVVYRESGPGVIGFDDEFSGVNVPTLGRDKGQDANTFTQVMPHPPDGGVIGFGPGDEVEGQPGAGSKVVGKVETWRSGLTAGESGAGLVAQYGGPGLKGGGSRCR